jgi:uncharacterized linocin/CFP29 family protein
MDAQAIVDTGQSFRNSMSGRWAGEQLLKALKEGKPLNASTLRTCDTLQKDEWIAFDDALVQEGIIRLRGIADLMAAGLVINVPNAMGKTLFQWEKVGDMNPAEVSLSGIPRTEDDRVEFDLGNLPLPITHKDWNISLRTLEASRTRGESLDTTQARIAGRLVAEELERMLFQGGKTFGGNTIYGYTNHPNRNTASFGTNGAWSAAAKTGENILTDVLTMITALEADRMNGPYWLYVPGNSSVKLENDFKSNSDKSIRSRLLEVDRIAAIRVADQLPADNVILVQATQDVVALVNGESLQTVQWDIEGGFVVKFKAFAIQVPLIRADATGRSGVLHMS